MSRKRKQPARVVTDSKSTISAMTSDSMTSMYGGLGNIDRDKAAGTKITENRLSDRDYAVAYGSNWIARKIVDVPANDALRKWRTWSGEHAIKIEKEEKRLGLAKKILKAYKRGRLMGGGAVLIGTDQDHAKPLDPSKIGKGGLKYLTVLGRSELTERSMILDPLDEYHGMPESYQIANSSKPVDIHPSHFVIFTGDELEEFLAPTTAWGQSVLKTSYDTMIRADGTAANIFSLIFEANVDVISIPDLMTKIGCEEGEAQIIKRFMLAALGKGINGTLILDGEESYERKTASFANLDNVMIEFFRLAAASAYIPITKFLEVSSSSGLQSTGEGDMNNYHDMLQGLQEFDIEPAMSLLDQCLVNSAGADAESAFVWNPFKQMDEKELAEIGKLVAETVKIMGEFGEGGSFTDEEIREIAITRFTESGIFPNIREVLDELSAEPDFDLEVEPEIDPEIEGAVA